VTRVAREARKVRHIAGIGQLVEIDHRSPLSLEPVQDEIRAYKTGATSDKNRPHSDLQELGTAIAILIRTKTMKSIVQLPSFIDHCWAPLAVLAGKVISVSRDYTKAA
jgi:hypothetical protein